MSLDLICFHEHQNSMNDSESSVTGATWSSLPRPWNSLSVSSRWDTLWSRSCTSCKSWLSCCMGSSIISTVVWEPILELDNRTWSDHRNEVVNRDEKEVTWSSWLWTWWWCQLLVVFMGSRSSHVHFFTVTSLPIQSTYGLTRNSQDLFQKFEPDNTTKYLFKFGEVLSVSVSLPFLYWSVSKSWE